MNKNDKQTPRVPAMSSNPSVLGEKIRRLCAMRHRASAITVPTT